MMMEADRQPDQLKLDADPKTHTFGTPERGESRDPNRRHVVFNANDPAKLQRRHPLI